MGILGITNRTENWKTVQHFHGLSDDGKVHLVEKLGKPVGTPDEEIKIELFWKGVRDYAAIADKPTPEKMAEIYNRHFSDLRQQICDFRKTQPNNRKFRPLQDHNYVADSKTRDNLYQNLQNTEIDVVLETPQYLFIGEAKHESDFGNDGKHVLVHQIIRQYVTAKLLVEHLDQAKQVIPFIVADREKLASVNNTAQVKFMVKKCWLKPHNILSWDCIAAIKESRA